MNQQSDAFHKRAFDQFTSVCNIAYLAKALGTDFNQVLQQAVVWLVPLISREANYHIPTINNLFVNHIQSYNYDPLKNTLLRNPFPDKEIDYSSMQIKVPYNYLDKAPQVFKQKEMLANIIKNNLPGNQKTRYLPRETSIYDEEQELCNVRRKDQTKLRFYHTNEQ